MVTNRTALLRMFTTFLVIMVSGQIMYAQALAADKPLEIKMVTLAPPGTSPHSALLQLAEKWHRASEGKVKLTVIGGYRAGGEAAIVDKMNVGGVDAAVMTNVGLSKITPAVKGIIEIPMIYDSLDELDYVVGKLAPQLEEKFESRGYVMLFWTDIGWVRHFSVKSLFTPDEYKKMKVFVWSGSSQQAEIMKEWGIKPVILETSDILPALSTGMIDEVTTTPFSANASQYTSVVKHMLVLNWAPLIGGGVIRKQTWEKIPAPLRQELLKIAAETGKVIKTSSRRESDEAVEAMKKKMGLSVNVPTAKQTDEWRQLVKSAYPRIRGSMIPTDAFDATEAAVAEYRKRAQRT
jgi:TRAP-type transport system periplasmic protein